MSVPAIGRIVHYKLSSADAQDITRRRGDARFYGGDRPSDGGIVHVGNEVRIGDVYPMMITRNWGIPSGLVSGQVFLDGNDTLWVKSVAPGPELGEYTWPVIDHRHPVAVYG